MELWQQELRACVRTIEQLEKLVPIEHREHIRKTLERMRLSITPHTLKLIDFNDPHDPLLRMSVPQERELLVTAEELADPIGDDAKSPLPFLTHRYLDRVLIYVTFFCSSYCRFCFRRAKTGQAAPGPSEQDFKRIYDYLREHPEIDEVILTGGDPLTLVDDQLETILKKLRAIPSVVRLRIHTRVPVTLPSRITPPFVAMLKRYLDATHPIFLVTHFNHPKEITPINIEAIARLVDAGIVVRNQSVLLRGVNDSAAILERLFKTLTNIRVVPYYLHQLDLAQGTNPFRVPIEQGKKFMRELQGGVTGIALPRYMLDIPGGHGKIPLQSQYLTRIAPGKYQIKNGSGQTFNYQEPTNEDDQSS